MMRNLCVVLLGGFLFFSHFLSLSAKSTGIVPPITGKIPVAVVITEHANLIDFAGPWEVFTSVRVPGRGNSRGMDTMEDDQYPFQVYTVGDSVEPLRVGMNLTVVPQYTFENAPKPKVVVVGAQSGSDKMKAYLKKLSVDPQTDVIMSVCTGAFRLASAGLLDNKPATTHHAYYSEFSKYFPKVRVEKNTRYVQSDQRIFTAGGLTSGIDLALHIVGLYFGEKTENATAEWLEHKRS